MLSHGSVSRGAIHALLGRGFSDLTVYTQRPPWGVHDKVPGCRYARMRANDSGMPMGAAIELAPAEPRAMVFWMRRSISRTFSR